MYCCSLWILSRLTLAYFRISNNRFQNHQEKAGHELNRLRRKSLCHLLAQLPLRWLSHLIAGNVEFILRFLYIVQEGSSSYSLGKLCTRLKLECTPDQNITIMPECYESKAYVWQIVRLGFTFLTAKNILLNTRLISDGPQNPNNDPLF